MAGELRVWKRQREAFWRAHHEGWKRSDLNQRQYCEVHGLPPKAFENWRQRFRLEPEAPQRKLLYRRRELGHPLSPGLSPPLSHPSSQVTYPSSELDPPVVAPPLEGHRRRFSEADKRRILDEAVRTDTSLAAVARRYGIVLRVLRRWKQEWASAPAFVTVQIADTEVAPATREAVS